MTCIHGTDTGKKWGACNCTAVECRCTERLDALRARYLRDKVDYHTRYARAEDPFGLGFVLVRSKFCSPESCSYFTKSSFALVMGTSERD